MSCRDNLAQAQNIIIGLIRMIKEDPQCKLNSNSRCISHNYITETCPLTEAEILFMKIQYEQDNDEIKLLERWCGWYAYSFGFDEAQESSLYKDSLKILGKNNV